MKAGRKSKYETHVKPRLLEIAAWCRDGVSEKKIAENLNISSESLYVYKKQFPEFSDTLRDTREIADITVENSVFKSANGYEYTETKEVYEHGELIKEEKVTKFVQPNPISQQYWLNNRKPSKWSNKQKMEHMGTIKTRIVLGGDPEKWKLK